MGVVGAIAKWLGIALGVMLVLAAGLFGAVQTGWGKRWIVAEIEALISAPDLRVEIGRLEGLVPFDMTVRDVRIADRQGAWLTLDRARLDWAPLALLGDRLSVQTLDLGTLTLVRLPPGAPADQPLEPEGDAGAAQFLPEIPIRPFDLGIDSLTIERAVLPDDVAGTPVALSLSGGLSWTGEGLALSADVARLGTQERLTAALDLAPGAGQADIDLHYRAPGGGFADRLLGLPGQPDVALDLSAAGPLRDWRLTLSARLDEAEVLAGRVTVSPDGPALALDADLTGDPRRFLPPDLARLAGQDLRAGLAGTITAEGAWRIDRFAIDAPGLTLSGQPGSEDRLTISGGLGEPGLFAPLIGPIEWQTVGIDGTLARSGLAGDVRLSWSGLSGLDPALDPVVANGTARLAATPESDMTWQVEALALDLPALALSTQGQVDLTAPRLDLAGEVRSDNLDLLSDLTGQRLSGALAGNVSLTATNQAVSVAFEGAGQDLATGIAEADRLLGGAPEIAIDARLAADGSLGLDRLAVTGVGAAAALSGQVAGQAIDITGTASVDDLSAIDPILAGRATAGLSLEGTLAQPRVTLDLSASAFAVAAASLAPLAGQVTLTPSADGVAGSVVLTGQWRGEPLSLEASAAADAAFARVRVEDLALTAGQASATGDLGLSLAPLSLSGTLRAETLDLALAAPFIGAPLTGTAGLTLRAAPDEGQSVEATLTLDQPALEGIGRMDMARIEATLTDLFAAPTGTVRLVASGLDGPMAGLQSVDLTLTSDLAGGTVGIAGDLAGITLPDIGTLAGATVDLTVTDPLGAAPGLTGRIDGQTVDLAGSQAASVTIDLDIADLPATPSGQVEVTGDQMVVGGLRLGRVTASAEGDPSTLAVEAQAAGDALSGQVGGTVALAEDGGVAVDLARASLTAYGVSPRLTQATRITIGADGAVALTPASFALADGTVTIAGQAAPAFDLTVTLAGLRLAALPAEYGVSSLAGSAGGEVRVTGPADAPSAALDLVVDGLSTADTLDLGLSAFRASINGRVTPGAADLTARLSGSPGEVTASGQANLAAETLQASASGTLDLSAVAPLVQAAGGQIAGTATIDLRATGPIASPDLEGTVDLAGGRFANPLYGVALTDISGTLAATGDRISLDDLSARTPNGGTIDISGAVTVADGTVTAALVADNAQFVDLDAVTAIADADLDLGGRLTAGLTLTGTVTLRDVRARIAGVGSTSVPTIEVVETNPVTPEQAARINAAADRIARQEAADPNAGLTLDVAIDANDAVQVDGLGLSAQFGGGLDLTGTTSDPRLAGDLELRRGTFDILGRRLEFSRGQISFLGDPFAPVIDFEAEVPAGEVTGILGLEGPVDAPALTIEAVPPLPEDEVLAQVLFGKGTRDLSPLEAAQLAREVAALSGLGGGGDLLGDLQSALGLEQLDISVGGAGEDAALGITEEIVEDVRVGVEQDLSGEAGRVTVEVEITPNITVDSAVGGEGGEVGIAVQWDY